MLIPKESKEEKEEGPWGEPLTASGARSQTKHSISRNISRTRHSSYKWVWDAFNGRNSEEKKGFLSTKISTMSL
eukprot:12249510-Prorocentrum_lima.AAC.1